MGACIPAIVGTAPYRDERRGVDGKGACGATAWGAELTQNLNTNSLQGSFRQLTARLRDDRSRLDWVLANTTQNKLTQIDGVDLRGDSHWALAAEVR
jgi:hypothetical protein